MQLDISEGDTLLFILGDIDIIYPWAPRIVPLQMFRVGQLVISAVPAEFTTMSGRYLKNKVSEVRREGERERDIERETERETKREREVLF